MLEEVDKQVRTSHAQRILSRLKCPEDPVGSLKDQGSQAVVKIWIWKMIRVLEMNIIKIILNKE